MMDKVIQQYQDDENIMIRLFAQWCANHQLNAATLYEKAYPQQQQNVLLLTIMEETEKDAFDVETETVLHVLQLFGNDDLAYEVSKVEINIK